VHEDTNIVVRGNIYSSMRTCIVCTRGAPVMKRGARSLGNFCDVTTPNIRAPNAFTPIKNIHVLCVFVCVCEYKLDPYGNSGTVRSPT